MYPFKRILCPTDFSEPSLGGLKLAAEIAATNGTELVVLHVHRPIPHLPKPRRGAPDVTFDVASYEEAVRQETVAQLGSYVQSVLPDEVQPRLIVRMGRPAKEILACAEEEQVDAIVIATHGRTGLRQLVFGSVAEMVVRYAPCPVLTTRARD